MIIPPQINLSEDEVLRVIDDIVDIIAPSFVFGYYDLDDIKQEARIEGLKALADYNGSHDLKNFLFVHIKFRLLNLKRNKYRRTDAPCKLCHNLPEGQTKHRNRRFCERYRKWFERNQLRKNLLYTQDVETVPVESPDNPDEAADRQEIFRLIDERLPPRLREYYLKMRCGLLSQVPKTKRQLVLRTVQKILKAENVY